MPPFWAELRKLEEEEGLSVLPTDPEGYAEDPEDLNPPAPRQSSRPLFPAGVTSVRGSSGSRRAPATLPSAVIKSDPRRERQFSNRHVLDKREGAASRAEALRAQILRGNQVGTVMMGSKAFTQRGADGYADCDEAQPEGCKGKKSKRPAEAPSESSCSESSEFDAGRLPSRRRRERAAGEEDPMRRLSGFVRSGGGAGGSSAGTSPEVGSQKRPRPSDEVPRAALPTAPTEVVVDYF